MSDSKRSKRAAAHSLTKDRGESESEEEQPQSHEPVDLSQRKILKPKRTTTEGKSAGLFGSFTFGNKPDQATAAPALGGFLSAGNSGTAPKSTFGSGNLPSFSATSAAPAPAPKATPAGPTALQQLESLNQSFLAWIQKQLNSETTVDLTECCKSYMGHAQKLVAQIDSSGDATAPAATTASSAPAPKTSSAPAPTASSAPATTVSSATGKPAEPAKPPLFGSGFGASAASATPAATSTPSFGASFAVPATTSTVSFGASSAALTSTASFGASFAAPTATSAAAFGANLAAPAPVTSGGLSSLFGLKPAVSAPSLGAAVEVKGDSAESAKPAIKFGASDAFKSKLEPLQPVATTAAPAAAPAAAQGTGESASKPEAKTTPLGLTFGAPSTTAAAAASFFGAPAASAATSTPGLVFGASPASSAAPAFSAGKLTFGASLPASSSQTAPASTAPSFAPATPAGKPAPAPIAFGAPLAATSTASSSAPSFPVLAFAPTSTPLFSGLPGLGASAPLSSGLFANLPQSSAAAEEEGGEDADEAAPEEQIKLQKEDSLYTAENVKVLYMDDKKAWTKHGSGNLMIQKGSGEKSYNLVVRVAGVTGTYLINAKIVPALPVAKNGDKGINVSCMPVEPLKLTKLTTFAIKFPDASLASEALEKLNHFKSIAG